VDNLLRDIIKEYVPIKDTIFNDPALLTWTFIGTLLIAVTFSIIGFICIIKANIPGDSYAIKKRKILTQLFGIFILSCGISRFLSVMALWYNYAILRSIVDVITGIISLFALIYTPLVIKEIKKASTIEQVKQSLHETQDKIDNLQNLTNDKRSDK
jgi:multisubunit Na+/H+ antiporter MnhG subunit